MAQDGIQMQVAYLGKEIRKHSSRRRLGPCQAFRHTLHVYRGSENTSDKIAPPGHPLPGNLKLQSAENKTQTLATSSAASDIHGLDKGKGRASQSLLAGASKAPQPTGAAAFFPKLPLPPRKQAPTKTQPNKPHPYYCER